MRKLGTIGIAGAIAASLLAAAAPSLAAAPSSPPAIAPAIALHAGVSGRIRGLVPAARGPLGQTHRPSAVELAGTAFASTGNLSYFGGPVMHANTTYAIYWTPPGSTVSAKYSPLINGFLSNVASASGALTNVYSSDTQYSDTSGPIAYSSTFGGSYVDATTPIPNDCSGQYAGTGVTVSGCVTDSDLRAEVSRASAAAGWVPSATKEFFVFTPRSVGSCLSPSTTCAFTYYCAYHSSFVDSLSRQVLYANQPYTDTSGVGAPGACDSGQHPNGDWADATISVLSHEHNETITDPLGNAWHDSLGNENGDKCAWNFGTSLGSTTSGQYNQRIGTGVYYTQQEWSNASSSCVLTYTPSLAPAISSFTPSSGAAKTVVTITGTNFTGATAVKFNGVSATFTVNSATGISTTAPSSVTSGPITVTTAKGTATSATWFWVPATISSFSPTSGKAGTAVAISGANFTGATAVKFNGVAASFTVTSSSKISTTVPTGATTGRVTVTTPAGTATSSTSFTVQ